MAAEGYFSHPRPRLFGHRGAAGLAPENTLESFRRAVSEGAEYLELDLHSTRDGVPVVIHDSTLDRTTDGSGPVRERSFAELRGYDAGFRFEEERRHPYRGRGIRVPALEELLDEMPEIPLNIELKQADPPIERAVTALLERKDALGRVVLAAEDDAIMRRIRATAPGVATSASRGEILDFFARCFGKGFEAYASAARALQIPAQYEGIELVTPETLAAAHGVGLEVHVWTVNERDEMERLLRLGVDGVMSDLPGLLVTVARRLSQHRKRGEPRRDFE
jgi:glycerophosphoryl diester phosphodiesterase